MPAGEAHTFSRSILCAKAARRREISSGSNGKQFFLCDLIYKLGEQASGNELGVSERSRGQESSSKDEGGGLGAWTCICSCLCGFHFSCQGNLGWEIEGWGFSPLSLVSYYVG